MALSQLDIVAVRNIQTAHLTPSPQINVIVGANGSGKSALLEAIFILGRSRSFRTSHIKHVISFNQPHLLVTGDVQQTSGLVCHLGIQLEPKQCLIRIDQETRKKADLAYSLPLQLIQPKSYLLLDAGPNVRREYLDWGIFNDQPTFLSVWRHYNKALQQRNALLKSRNIRAIAAWDDTLCHYGLLIHAYRLEYMALLEPVFKTLTTLFLPTLDVSLRFMSGWDEAIGLDGLLKKDLEKDLRYGFTHSGPHRADFQVLASNRLARDCLSRGQLKLLVIALLLSQAQLVNETSSYKCCILIDDITAELDTENKAKLLKYLALLNCQVFLTATDINQLDNWQVLGSPTVFHVEHGQIQLRL
jgi:DNA replication and repair protein RecF